MSEVNKLEIVLRCLAILGAAALGLMIGWVIAYAFVFGILAKLPF